jgi:hypothetical protein
MFTNFKVSRVALAALSLAVISGATQVATAATWKDVHPRRAEVNARLHRENSRIHEERRDGEISRGRAHRLHAEVHAIRNEERTLAHQNGGHITRGEQHRINRQENALSRHIGH